MERGGEVCAAPCGVPVGSELEAAPQRTSMEAFLPFQITAVFLDGRTIQLLESPYATVADVKTHLSQECGHKADRLYLLWGNKRLANGESLTDLGLPRDGASLNVLVRKERFVCSGSEDGELRVWSLDTGACLRSMRSDGKSQDSAVRCIAVSWDEMLALCGYTDRRLRLWDLKTGACVLVFDQGHKGMVRGVSVHWAAGVVLSCGQDGCMKLWDLRAGTCLRTYHCGRGQVFAVSADWRTYQAMSVYQNGHLALWDLASENETCMRTFAGHRKKVTALNVDWKSRRALTGAEDCRMRLWDLDTGDCLCPYAVKPDARKGEVVNAIAADWAKERALSGCGDASLQVWDIRTAECLFRLDDARACPWCAVATMYVTEAGAVDCSSLTGSPDGALRLWNFATGTCLKILEGHQAPVLAVAAGDL